MISDFLIVKAKLKLYSFENGGRKTGIKSGYRPNHVFEYKKKSNEFNNCYAGQIEFDEQLIYPNKVETVIVRFLNHQNISELIEKGRIWWIHEGLNKIGEAEVLEVIKT